MFKEIFTRLIRHLPSRLVHRDPLPGAQQTVNAAVPSRSTAIRWSATPCVLWAPPW